MRIGAVHVAAASNVELSAFHMIVALKIVPAVVFLVVIIDAEVLVVGA